MNTPEKNIEYDCKTHGRWDARRESGCPSCVGDMREEIEKLKAEKLAEAERVTELRRALVNCLVEPWAVIAIDPTAASVKHQSRDMAIRAFVGNEMLRSDYRSVADMRATIEKLKAEIEEAGRHALKVFRGHKTQLDAEAKRVTERDCAIAEHFLVPGTALVLVRAIRNAQAGRG